MTISWQNIHNFFQWKLGIILTIRKSNSTKTRLLCTCSHACYQWGVSLTETNDLTFLPTLFTAQERHEINLANLGWMTWEHFLWNSFMQNPVINSFGILVNRKGFDDLCTHSAIFLKLYTRSILNSESIYERYSNALSNRRFKSQCG